MGCYLRWPSLPISNPRTAHAQIDSQDESRERVGCIVKNGQYDRFYGYAERAGLNLMDTNLPKAFVAMEKAEKKKRIAAANFNRMKDEVTYNKDLVSLRDEFRKGAKFLQPNPEIQDVNPVIPDVRKVKWKKLHSDFNGELVQRTKDLEDLKRERDAFEKSYKAALAAIAKKNEQLKTAREHATELSERKSQPAKVEHKEGITSVAVIQNAAAEINLVSEKNAKDVTEIQDLIQPIPKVE